MKSMAALLLVSVATTAVAQERRPAGSPAPSAPPATSSSATASEPARPASPAKDQISTTQHTVTINGQAIAYTARTGTIVMRDEEGKDRASFFFVSYTRDGGDPGKRPVTFTFNGGPGSSSVWLHMGAFGPRRVVYRDDEGHAAVPPYRLTDNEYSVLDVTDLVFIDPVTTGFSRAIPFADAKKFHGVDADIESVGEFIRLWTTRYGRWLSPKFLAGESYGTTRAAGLSGWLQRQGYYLNGIMLISSILNFQTAYFDNGNDMPYALFLPTYTAIAWYHKQLPAEMQRLSVEEVTRQAEEFALGDYTRTLMKGDAVPDAERRAIVQKLSQFTGLSTEWIDRANMRVRIDRFDKELLRAERRSVGRLDGRFIGIDRDAAGESPDFDPSYAAIFGEYTAAFNDYIRRELKFETDAPYEILTGKVRPWSYDSATNRFVDVSETLRNAMSQNPHMKVWVANGYYDLATPFAATRYTFGRLQLDPEIRKNVSMSDYEGGHMMYIDRKAHAKMRQDMVNFIRTASNVQ
jgi:carboxypeptidase C (cathepsin A)